MRSRRFRGFGRISRSRNEPKNRGAASLVRTTFQCRSSTTAACTVGLQSVWPSPLKQRMRHLGHKAAGPFNPGLYCLKSVRRPRSKDGSHSQAGDPRGPSTCHHLCNLQPTHLIEAPRNRACSTQIAMPTRVYRPRPRWRASLSFAKPGSSSWLSLDPHCLDLGAASGASEAFGWPRAPLPRSPNPPEGSPETAITNVR